MLTVEPHTISSMKILATQTATLVLPPDFFHASGARHRNHRQNHRTASASVKTTALTDKKISSTNKTTALVCQSMSSKNISKFVIVFLENS
jgi:hypothetical protein